MAAADRRVRVGLLFGGKTVEHRVSVVSARGVAAGLDTSRVECIPLAVTRSGRWLDPERSCRILEGDEPEVPEDTGGNGSLAAVPGGGGLVFLPAQGQAVPLELDVIFPVVHGWGGEDGRIQGMLDLAGVPCVGAGVAGSAVAMDKGLARAILEREGIPMAAWRCLTAADREGDLDRLLDDLVDSPGLPLFVKPANGGSSVGISRVGCREDLRNALDMAFSHDRRVVVERALDAREIECAVLGNDRPEVAPPGEVVPAAEFYTYDDKYHDGKAGLHVPADLPEETADRVRKLALQVYRALDLAGMARIDFLLDRRDGTVHFNEANTLPGFTPISMYSRMWEAGGVPYPELLDRLIDLALRRGNAG